MNNFLITESNQVRFVDGSGNLRGVIANNANDCVYDPYTEKYIVTLLDGRVRFYDKNGNVGGPIISENAITVKVQDSNILLVRLNDGRTVKRDRNGNSR
jgi:hypothetical protein